MNTTTVYLLHFDAPISDRHTAQHYIGSCGDLRQRLQQHREHPDARLLQVARERHITFRLAATWPGDRQTERRLKNRKEGKRLCPICNGQAAQLDLFLEFTLDDVEEVGF